MSDGADPPVFSCQCKLGFSGTSCTTLTNFCTTVSSAAAGAVDGNVVCAATASLTTCLPITARNALGVLPGKNFFLGQFCVFNLFEFKFLGYVCVPANIDSTKSRCLSSGKQVDGSNLVQLQCSARLI